MPTADATTVAGPGVRGLPVEVDSFVGRRGELEDIRRLFADHPLVTLVGLGGVGKTRLALRSAARMSRTFPDRIWFVELGHLHDPALLLTTVAEATGLREQSSALRLEALLRHLGARRGLLVLDNCEHLLDEVATLADKLLRNCPDLLLLATSRERLGIHGEGVLQVSPLSAPSKDDPSDVKSLPRFEAVSLFTERAKAIRPGFELTADNGGEVAQICRELDGLPLALELAAARLGTLSPAELAGRLEDRFRVLTGGSRVAPQRHRTMRMCIDWSYEQCSPAERLLWSRLSVFVGTFALDAVEGTCAFGELSDGATLDALTSLVDKSIVTHEGPDIQSHFRLLATLREYGDEKLLANGERLGMRQRHRDWYVAMLGRVRREMFSDRQIYWSTRLDRELPNIRAAVEHSLVSHEAPLAQRMLGDLHIFWISRGLLSEGRYWLSRAIAADTTPSHDRSQAYFTAVSLAGFQGDIEAVQAAVEGCLEVDAALDDPVTAAYAASARGMLAHFTGDLPTAAAEYEAAAAGHAASGDTLRQVEVLIGLALVRGLTGDLRGAAATHERILEITQPRGEIWYRGYSLWALGISEWRQGNLGRAEELLGQSLLLRRQMYDVMGSAWCVEGFALVAGAAGEYDRAAVLLGASAALSDLAGTPPATFLDLVSASGECEEQARASLGSHAFDRAFEKGRCMDVAASATYALREAPEASQASGRSWTLLTKREREVAELVAAGLTNRAIADKLVISPRTAEAHVEKILTKLGLTSRTQVAAWLTQDS